MASPGCLRGSEPHFNFVLGNVLVLVNSVLAAFVDDLDGLPF